MNKKILNQVVSNDDNYCWKNLTCTYRPWMTGFKSFGQNYEDAFLLLVSFMEIYFDEKEDKQILDFLENYKKHLEQFLGIRIRKWKFQSLPEMKSVVKDSINQEQPVLVPCDLIALPYNPMYMLEHRYKCMLIKGYDEKRDLFFLLDNIHIDYGSSTILTDFASLTSEIYNMNKEISASLKYNQCLFSLQKLVNKDIREYTILRKLREFINLYLNKPEMVIHWEKRLKIIVHKENAAKIIEEIIKTLDFKYVFRDRLNKLFQNLLGKNDSIESLCKEYDDVCFEWMEIQNKILYSENYGMDSLDFQKKVQNAEQNEYFFMVKLAAFIDQLPDKKIDDKVRFENFNVLNNSNALINKKNNGYEIEHDKKRKYDTWQMQDNACQLLLDNVSEGQFEVKVHCDTCFGEDIHSGIIVKLRSGVKYLFGNVRGRMIAIYCPDLDDNFELYTKNKIVKNEARDDVFKVSINAEEISFYYMEEENPIYSVSIENDVIASVGIFSKTWEYLEHRVYFYDIKNELR